MSSKKTQKVSSAASNAATPPASAPTSSPTATPSAPVAWIDDASNPRKQMIAKVVLVGVWIYVAALWLLALDQTFHWGIFKP